LNNDFRYAENIHSVYGIVGQQFDRLGYQLGLRVEQTFTTSELITTLDTFENDYFSLFPSAFLTYKLSQASQLQLNYSRRINRPRTRQLNPFPDLEDPFNIRRGNPFLLPEYIDAFELGYAFNKKRQTVTASLYYRMMHDMIQRIRRIDTLTNVSTRTYENLSSGTSLGVELVYVGKLTKWLNFNSSFNFFRSVIDGGENLNNRGYGYTGRMMATFRLPKSYNLQLSGFYRGPSPTAQGRRNGMGSINLAVQKRILKDKGNISLNVRDIFNIMRFQVDIDDPLFYQVFDRKWETRQATLTFSYRFGKQQFEQRRRGGRRGGGDDGMDMDF
jgi:iron complex outermembrane receptor protein